MLYFALPHGGFSITITDGGGGGGIIGVIFLSSCVLCLQQTTIEKNLYNMKSKQFHTLSLR